MGSMNGSAKKYPPMMNHASLPNHTECNPNYINPEDTYMQYLKDARDAKYRP